VSASPSYELIEIDRLKIHEHVRPELVAQLVQQIRRDGFVAEPVWVARGSNVVLNGHHRFAALRELGARKVPAWVFDYDSDLVALERWSPGPPLSKREIEARAAVGDPYPPKTTKHTVVVPLPDRPTPLSLLGVPEGTAQDGGGARSRGTVRASERS
jgi:L-serine kinase (ADP)